MLLFKCVYLFLQLHQYQYYSTGLLSTHDPFYEQQRHLLGPKKKKIKDEKKFKGTVKKKTVIKWLLFISQKELSSFAMIKRKVSLLLLP